MPVCLIIVVRLTAEYPDIEPITRTTCDRVEMTVTSLTWCTDKLLDVDIKWLLCWNVLIVRSELYRSYFHSHITCSSSKCSHILVTDKL